MYSQQYLSDIWKNNARLIYFHIQSNSIFFNIKKQHVFLSLQQSKEEVDIFENASFFAIYFGNLHDKSLTNVHLKTMQLSLGV